MQEKEEFRDYVARNIDGLEELTAQYGNLKIELVQHYWKMLLSNVQTLTPPGYTFVGKEISFVVADEHVIGWSRQLKVLGHSTFVTIGFGLHIQPQRLATSWPIFEKKSCWTGIKVWLPPNLKLELRKRAARRQLMIEPEDRNWILYQNWEPPYTASISRLYEHLTKSYEAGISEITARIIDWKTQFEAIAT